MTKTFQILVKGNLEAKLEVAKQKAANQGWRLEGDAESGTFSGALFGGYEISEGVATVTVTKKPPLIASWRYVEAQLRDFLSG
ncbi:MAG: hypothetical protein V3U17_03055 [Thermoplasmata archaeon]